MKIALIRMGILLFICMLGTLGMVLGLSLVQKIIYYF